MDNRSKQFSYEEMAAELQSLQQKVAQLEARFNEHAPAPSQSRRHFLPSRPARRGLIAVGVAALAVAGLAAATDPLTIENGIVKVGTLLVGNDLTVSGKLTANGAINAGNSDIYFTNTEHDHSAYGNTSGYAALENAKNFGALMILGRQLPAGRMIGMWDRVGIGTGTPQAALDVKGEIRGKPWYGGANVNNPAIPYGLSVAGSGGKFYNETLTMTRIDRSVCLLTGVGGKFSGGGEKVWIAAEGGRWVLHLIQGHLGADVSAQALCIGAPDNSW